MEEKILFSIVAGIIGFISAYFLKIIFRKDVVLEKLIDKSLTNKFDQVISLISAPGLNEILTFFSKKKPEDILKLFDGLAFLNQNIERQKDHLEKINRFITSDLFNELTGRLHDHIESNEKFIRRLKVNKNTKIYLKNHYTTHPLIQDI